MPERTTVRLPPELLLEAKRKAAAERRTLTSLIEEGLRAVMRETGQAARTARKLPRVSQAHGRVMPGLDLDDLSSIQHEEDVALVQRMKRAK